jgi:hypothetical protein
MHLEPPKFAKSLNVEASLSASYGVATVDAKSSFSKTLKTTSTSLSMIVSTRVVSGTETATGTITEFSSKAITESISAEGIGAFLSSYGDSFVNSITLGSEYYAVYTFFTESESEQSDLRTSFKASV